MPQRIPAEGFAGGGSVQRSAVYEQIVRRINEMLASGELAPGDRLPPERRLAEAFGVSRNSVREAIRVLTQRGVVETRPGSGTYVAQGRDDDLVAGIADSMLEGRTRLREVMEVRLILEPRVARMAAVRATSEDVAALRGTLEMQRRDVERGGTGAKQDEAFHASLASMCGNALLHCLLGRMHGMFAESRDEVLVPSERRMASLAVHEAIVAAIEHGDGAAAERRMARHVRDVADRLFPDGGLAVAGGFTFED
ncbi:FadR/GntR family transcriptional regulator [Desulfobaculum senezii]